MKENSLIKIGTVNLQNNKINRMGGLRPDGIDTSSLIANHIETEKFDILGTQELTKQFSSNITSKLSNYKLYGGYRYGDGLLNKFKLIRDFNENNNIIVNSEITSEITKKLPFIPNNIIDLKSSIKNSSIMPRIVTIVLTKINNINICAINTHLEYQIPSIQKRQLEVLKNIIEKYYQNYQIILTGDFNMEITEDNLKEFIDNILNYNLKRVEVNDKTLISFHKKQL